MLNQAGVWESRKKAVKICPRRNVYKTIQVEKSMTDEQVLTKAIEIAVENGWDDKESKLALEVFGLDNLTSIEFSPRYFLLIFNHDFAKAFWKKEGNSIISGTDLVTGNKLGDDKYYVENHETGEMTESWQYHLTQMVLHPNPLEYIKQYLKGKQ